MKRFILVWAVVGLASLAMEIENATSAFGEVISVVSPSAQESVEGDSSVQPSAMPNRIQFLYPAADFAALPASQRWLVGMSNRGDQTQSQSVNWTLPDIELWISTTSKDSSTLSTVFADNHGPDKTLVHSGSYMYSILGTGPAGGPKDFADAGRFQTPFYYDPSQGNLLIEQIHRSPSTPNLSPRVDVQSTPGFTIVGAGFDLNATSGELFTGLAVTQFQFAVPEPSTIVFAGLALLSLFPRRANNSTKESRVQ